NAETLGPKLSKVFAGRITGSHHQWFVDPPSTGLHGATLAPDYGLLVRRRYAWYFACFRNFIHSPLSTYASISASAWASRVISRGGGADASRPRASSSQRSAPSLSPRSRQRVASCLSRAISSRVARSCTSTFAASASQEAPVTDGSRREAITACRPAPRGASHARRNRQTSPPEGRGGTFRRTTTRRG